MHAWHQLNILMQKYLLRTSKVINPYSLPMNLQCLSATSAKTNTKLKIIFPDQPFLFALLYLIRFDQKANCFVFAVEWTTCYQNFICTYLLSRAQVGILKIKVRPSDHNSIAVFFFFALKIYIFISVNQCSLN